MRTSASSRRSAARFRLAIAAAALFAPPAPAGPVEVFSWPFHNFDDNSSEAPCDHDLPWDTYRISYIGVPVNEASALGTEGVFYDTVYKTLLARPGNCFGMCLMSLLIHQNGGHLGFCGPLSQFPGDLTGSCTDAKGNPQFTGPYDPRLALAINQTHGQQVGMPCAQHFLDVLTAGDIRRGDYAYDQALQHMPALVSISDAIPPGTGKLQGAHTLIVYDAPDSTDPGTKYLSVYDPNRSYADPQWKQWYDQGDNLITISNSSGE